MKFLSLCIIYVPLVPWSCSVLPLYVVTNTHKRPNACAHLIGGERCHADHAQQPSIIYDLTGRMNDEPPPLSLSLSLWSWPPPLSLIVAPWFTRGTRRVASCTYFSIILLCTLHRDVNDFDNTRRGIISRIIFTLFLIEKFNRPPPGIYSSYPLLLLPLSFPNLSKTLFFFLCFPLLFRLLLPLCRHGSWRLHSEVEGHCPWEDGTRRGLHKRGGDNGANPSDVRAMASGRRTQVRGSGPRVHQGGPILGQSPRRRATRHAHSRAGLPLLLVSVPSSSPFPSGIYLQIIDICTTIWSVSVLLLICH